MYARCERTLARTFCVHAGGRKRKRSAGDSGDQVGKRKRPSENTNDQPTKKQRTEVCESDRRRDDRHLCGGPREANGSVESVELGISVIL